MNRKLQVFISSTFIDLKAERQAAVEAILSARHIPAGMELFTAGDEEQMVVIRRWIDESDVYLLILGGRYGSVDPKTGKSYTQLEYEYAVKKKKPLFAVYITDEYQNKKIEKERLAVVEQERPKELKDFRNLVLGKMCRSFGSLDELKLAVILSINDFALDASLTGWVRGSDVVDPKATFEEIARLREENNVLRSELAKANLTKGGLDALFDGAPLEEVARQLATEPVHVARNNEAYKMIDDHRHDAGDAKHVSALRLFMRFFGYFVNGFQNQGKTSPHYFLYLHVAPRLAIFGLVEKSGGLYIVTPQGRRFYNLVKKRLDELDPLPNSGD